MCQLRCAAHPCARNKDGTCQNIKSDGTVCGKALDLEGMHATMCCSGGAAIARHSAIRDALAALAREQHAHIDLGLDVNQAAACENTGARLDVQIPMPDIDKCMLIDVAGAPGKAAMLADAANNKTHTWA